MGASLCCMKQPAAASSKKKKPRAQEASPSILIIKSPEKLPILKKESDYDVDHGEEEEEEEEEEAQEKRVVGGSLTLHECLQEEDSSSTILIIESPEKIPILGKKRDNNKDNKEDNNEGFEEKRMVGRISTLKDCLLGSPGNCLDPTKIQVTAEVQQDNSYGLHDHLIKPTKVQVVTADVKPLIGVITSPEIRTVEFYTPRISFSSDKAGGKLVKIDEKEEEEEEVSFTPILRTSGSERLKKKVSFRFPEEADIFVIYSPQENFGDK